DRDWSSDVCSSDLFGRVRCHRLRCQWPLACELADGAQQSQPMSERNTELDQMLVGQLRQDIGFDHLFAEQSFVLFEAETAQPRPDVHLGPSPLPNRVKLSRDDLFWQVLRIPASLKNARIALCTGQVDRKPFGAPILLDQARKRKSSGTLPGCSL